MSIADIFRTRVQSVDMPTTLRHGQKTVATVGTEVPLAASSTPLLAGVMVKALAANTGTIYVGANPVTLTTGFELLAGESIFLAVSDLATVYVDSTVNGEGVSYIGT